MLPEGDRDADRWGRRLLDDAGGKMEFPAVMTGALTGLGIDALLRKIDEVLPMDRIVTRRFVSAGGRFGRCGAAA